MPEPQRQPGTLSIQDGHARTVQAILTKLDKLGDLPIFSASVNHIRRVSSDPNSDAMELGQVVMKDANLSIKLLRLANSAYYNRNVGKIGAVSRAVVLLGFNTIKSLSLTLKLLESFQHEQSSADIGKLLVRSYLTAGFVREMSAKCGIRDVEESYVCGLLHRLGEIAVSYFLPEQYARINTSRAAGQPPAEAEMAALDTTFSAVGQALANAWEFPNAVINSMIEHNGPAEGAVSNPAQYNNVMVSLSSRLIETLYSQDPLAVAGFDQLMRQVAKAAGLDAKVVEHCLGNSFQMSCDLAETYGVNKRLLRPELGTAGDNGRDQWARRLAYIASGETAAPVLETTPALQSAHAPGVAAGAASATAGDPMLQLEILQDITSLISSEARISAVFLKVLEGIQSGAGFDRALLCLVTPDRRHCVGRLTKGRDTEELKTLLSFPLQPENDLLSQIVVQGRELLVEDPSADTWRHALPAALVATTVPAFAVAGLVFKDRPVGLIYADRALNPAPATPEQYRSFLQFVAQARLALRLCQ